MQQPVPSPIRQSRNAVALCLTAPEGMAASEREAQLAVALNA
jgi:hypothetical protein